MSSSMRAANRWWAAASAAVVALGLVALAGPALAQDDPREAFRRGIDLFEQGQYKEAKLEFERFLAAMPSDEVALEMQNEAGYQVFVEMLARKDDLATIARKVLELAERGRAKERQEPEKIQALVQQMHSDDFEASYLAMERLASQVGPFVVPFVVDDLADRRDNEKRVRAIVLLSKLGPDGAHAIIPLLRHKDDFVRQNACAILGHIRDFKAIPYLKAVAESKDESPHVRKEAQAALKNITGKDQLEPALVYFLALAERYYQEDPRVTINHFKDWTIWDWKDDKLSYRVVPQWMWNEEEAENACYAAIRHAAAGGEGADAVLDDIYTLLVSVFFQQLVECEALLELAEAKAAAGGVDPAEVEVLKGRKEQIAGLASLAVAVRGEPQVLKALRKALVDRRPELAVALIEAASRLGISEAMLPAEGADLAKYLEAGKTPVRAMEAAPRAPEPAPAAAPAPEPSPRPRTIEVEERPRPAPEERKPEPAPAPEGGSRRRRVSEGAPLRQPFGPEPLRIAQTAGEAHGASLAAALTNEDKRVRYAAAEALLRANPLRKFANADKVVPALASAVLESGSRVILVVAKDSQVRNRLVGDVRNMNHMPFGIETAKQGLIRARASAAVDAVLLHTELNTGGDASDFSVPEFLQQIEADYRTAGIPVVVLTPQEKLEETAKLYEGKAALVIGDNPDAVILRDQLEALWSGPKAKPGDPKAKAVEVARRAAEALAAADPRSPVFDLRLAVSALAQCLETQPDAVRVPALRALGNLRAREAVDKVAAIFDNPQNALEVRVAAAHCLGEALRGQPVPAKVYESLKAALKEGDAGLYAAAAAALGKAQLTREQLKDVLVDHRIE